jgi:hypothetical protein
LTSHEFDGQPGVDVDIQKQDQDDADWLEEHRKKVAKLTADVSAAAGVGVGCEWWKWEEIGAVDVGRLKIWRKVKQLADEETLVEEREGEVRLLPIFSLAHLGWFVVYRWAQWRRKSWRLAERGDWSPDEN